MIYLDSRMSIISLYVLLLLLKPPSLFILHFFVFLNEDIHLIRFLIVFLPVFVNSAVNVL